MRERGPSVMPFAPPIERMSGAEGQPAGTVSSLFRLPCEEKELREAELRAQDAS